MPDVGKRRALNDSLLGSVFFSVNSTEIVVDANAERDRYSTKQLRKVFGSTALTGIDAEAIAAYKSRRRNDGVAEATIAKELRTLSAAFNYAR